jgi:hypothetical protein
MATADRLEAELGPEQFMYDGGCQREIESSPEPGPPITVGLDGGYIRGRDRPLGAPRVLCTIAGVSAVVPSGAGADPKATWRKNDWEISGSKRRVLRTASKR